MARLALNYLEKNPVKERNWECKFNIYPTHIPYHFPLIPSNEYGYDVISIADSDLRMDMVYRHMRKLAGIDCASEAETGVRKRADSYVNVDGVCVSNPSACSGMPKEGLWITTWGTAHNVMVYCDEYERTGEQGWLDRAKRALDGILKYAVSTDGMKCFPAGIAPYRDGVWLKDGWLVYHSRNYAFIVEPLARYYEISGDKKYLHEAILFAEGIINRMRRDREAEEINPDTGKFGGHVHIHTRTLWGMSHLAALTGDARYTAWAKRMFDFVVKRGNDFGWYPEQIPNGVLSETCVNGDMMAAAYYLASCGFIELYDIMERNWRNYLYRTQFRVTPDFVELTRQVNEGKSEAEINEAIEKAKELEGGFIAQTTWSDLTRGGGGDKLLYMMGCCPPSGMLALYFIAKAAATVCGDSVYINLTATVDTDAAELISDYSKPETLTVRAKISGTYYLRIPEFCNPSEAVIKLNGVEIPREWRGTQCRYLTVKNVMAGDVITLGYPIYAFTQKLKMENVLTNEIEYTINWVGNNVTSVEPEYKYMDLFGEQRGI